MKAISIIRAVIARGLFMGTSYSTKRYSSSLAQTNYSQPKLHTKAINSTRYKNNLMLYLARKRGSKQVWVEKRDKDGRRTRLTRAGDGKVRHHRHHHGGSPQDSGCSPDYSGWGHQSEWTDEPELNRTAQYVYGRSTGIVGASSDHTYSNVSSSYYAHDGISRTRTSKLNIK